MPQLEDEEDQNHPWVKPFEKNKRLAIILAFFAAFVVGNVLFMSTMPGKSRIPIKSGTFKPSKAHEHSGKRGAVACDVPHCSQMGLDVLRKGGNSADAAVTVALCIGSINFHSSGIGGGAFINVFNPDGPSVIIDARETAPKGARKHMYDDNRDNARKGGLAAGVPGELRGLETMWRLYGSGNVTWKELVDPVVSLNRRGFATSEAITLFIKSANKQIKEWYRMMNSPGWEWFLPNGIDGQVPGLLKRERLADTLELVAKQGANAFYDPYGPIAPFLAEAAQQAGGILTAQDIANYKVVIKQPLNTTFMGRTVFTTPAPSSGPALLMALNVMEGLVTKDSRDMSPVDTQRLIEVMKWMGAARSELGDPAFIKNPKMEEMLTPEWAENVRNNVSDSHTLDSWKDYHPSYEMNEPEGTAHFSILDANGMAVAITTTVNLPFGNQVCDPFTGIILNSEMDDFSLPRTGNYFELAPSVYNFVEAGKRPLSSMVPTVVVDDQGKAETVIGAAGGSHITTAVLQALVRHYIYGVEGLGCIAFPRLHHQLLPEQVAAEYGIPDHVTYSLREKGHRTEIERAMSAMNGIFRKKSGHIHAVSDYWRKYGEAAAY